MAENSSSSLVEEQSRKRTEAHFMQIPEQSNNPEQPGQSTLARNSVVRRGTGPRTHQGKQKSKRNALKHGIFSHIVLIKDEPRAEFDSLRGGLRNNLEPEGTLEELLVDKLAALVWRHRRLIIADGELIQNRTRIELVISGDVIPGIPSLDLLLRYESNLERAFDRTLSQLERLQRMRMGQPVLPKLEVHHSMS
jgi:hypothetical protein